MPRHEEDNRGRQPQQQKRVFARPFVVQDRPNGFAIVDANGIELMASTATANSASFPKGLTLDEAGNISRYVATLLEKAAIDREAAQQHQQSQQRQEPPRQQQEPPRQQQSRGGYRGGNGGGYRGGNRNGGGQRSSRNNGNDGYGYR